MMRVLVTGGSGQLARPVAAGLRRSGCAPILLSRNALSGSDVESLTLATPWTADALREVIERQRIEAVVNLAAAGVRPGEAGTDLFDVNVRLVTDLLRAGAGQLRAMVNIGSGAEYVGGEGKPLDEAAPLTTTHAYGLSKAAAGLSGNLVGDQLSIPFAHLRLFGAYGEHEAAHRLLPQLARRLPAGEAVPLSDGDQVRDWLYEPDIADAVALTLRALAEGRVSNGLYNLGSGTGHSVRAFALTVAELLGAPESLLHFGAIERRPGEVQHAVAVADRLMACIGWRPRYSLAAGLAEALMRLSVLPAKHRIEESRS